MNELNEFADWLRIERLRQRLRQSELAQLSGVSLATISNIERGAEPHPTERTKQALRAALAGEDSTSSPKVLADLVKTMQAAVETLTQHHSAIEKVQSDVENLRKDVDSLKAQLGRTGDQTSAALSLEAAVLQMQTTVQGLVSEHTDPVSNPQTNP